MNLNHSLQFLPAPVRTPPPPYPVQQAPFGGGGGGGHTLPEFPPPQNVAQRPPQAKPHRDPQPEQRQKQPQLTAEEQQKAATRIARDSLRQYYKQTDKGGGGFTLRFQTFNSLELNASCNG